MPRKPKHFRREFKRQLRLAIAAAIGFTIAFAWRNVIFDSVYSFVRRINEETSLLQSQLTTAIIITVIGVLVIMLFSRLLRDRR